MASDKAYNKVDYSSQSNLSEAKTTQIHLTWDVDFEAQKIRGSAKHTVSVLQNTNRFVVDSNKLLITRATVQGQNASFNVAEPHAVFGSAVTIDLGNAGTAGSTLEVEIFYETHPEATATQWLPPAQTAGKIRPFLFTQCQAIHARSLLPCQDAPGNKVPYSAAVTVPDWATALMSAVSQSEKNAKNSKKEFFYEQSVPIPTYLIALAVGDLASRDLSQRCRVWAEPSMVDGVAYEFGQTEDFLQVAEQLTCPYMWTRYDVLCLPPSFPYGGMENPCLTFVTPTLLAGDRSLADVVAHEIAHSWTGNLITNQTWEHFWLNEGWTVWLERKIMAGIHKNDRYRHLAAMIGWKHLRDDVAHFGESNPLTQLIPPLEGVDPDDAFSSVPYEKGFALLFCLENIVGSEKFDEFAHAYIDRFKYSTITSGEFRDFFLEHFQHDKKALKKISSEVDWDVWFRTPGMPPYNPEFDQTLSNAALTLADTWLQVLDAREAVPRGVAPNDLEGWSTQQKLIFLEKLIDECEKCGTAFPESALSSMDQLYQLSNNRNSEISLRWQQLCLRSECSWIVPHVKRFITSQGRMKFVRPLYRALFNSTVGKAEALATFRANHSIYHPIARKMVATDLKIPLSELTAQASAPSERRVGVVTAALETKSEDVVPTAGAPPAPKVKTITVTPSAKEESSSNWMLLTTVAVAAAAAAAFYFARRR